MPKNVLPALLEELRRELRLRYPVGSRFLTTRSLARRYKVALQTAHRAVRQLEEEGLVRTADRVGIIVAAQESNRRQKRHLVVLTNNPDQRFNRAFLAGIDGVCAPCGVRVTLKLHAEAETRDSVELGRRIVGMECDGVIALGFRNVPLAFYHAAREGVDIVSDVELDGLEGTLPSLQTDNRRHTAEVAEVLLKLGKRQVLAAGYWTARPNRLRYFEEAVAKRARIISVCLSRPESVGRLHHFFEEFPPGGAVFSLDSSANWMLAPLFLQFGISPAGRFFLYDSEEAEFAFPGLPAVKGGAPSLKCLGERLAKKLLWKWEKGEWQEPVNERI